MHLLIKTLISTLNQKALISILACLCGTLLAGSACAQTGRGDDVILDMQKAYRSGDKRRLTALLPQARGHALEAQAAYWELKARLDEASPQEVQDMLQRYAGTYHEDRLRNDWLLLLGQRRDFSNFAVEYPKFRMNDDKEVRCYALLIDHIAGSKDVTDEVRRNWYAIKDADDGCTLAADRLYSEKKLSALDVWKEARLSMEANRGRATTNAVQIVAPDVAAQVSEINASPARYLASRVVAATSTRKELAALALIKMASADPDAAAAAMDGKWSVFLSSEERSWVWGVIGKQAALKLSSDAGQYFSKARNEHLNDDLLGWKTRAALRATDMQMGWPVVLTSINAMSEDAQKDPTWAYWKARALKAAVSGKSTTILRASVADGTPTAMLRPELAEAANLLESIASPRGFYEMLALDELGRKVAVPERPAALTADEKATARANPGLNRALYAIGMGLRSEGVREWNYSTNLHTRGGLSERDLLAAADLACQREVWDRCINTSERAKDSFDHEQRFPLPFKDNVQRRSREIGLDPAYVYGLIRQESRFIMDARSGVGAAGLMQVMPATARWTANKMGLSGFSTDQLSNRDTNIAIGTAYLKYVLDDFGGSMPLAAAAYNAGPNRPRAWRNGVYVEAAAWAENVPFSETRDYVKKVLANTTMYAAILTGQPQSLKSRLGNIGPREGPPTEVNKDLP